MHWDGIINLVLIVLLFIIIINLLLILLWVAELVVFSLLLLTNIHDIFRLRLLFERDAETAMF